MTEVDRTRNQISCFTFNHQVIAEIARVVAAMSAQVHVEDDVAEEERGEKVCLTEMILVPVDRYPRVLVRKSAPPCSALRSFQ